MKVEAVGVNKSNNCVNHRKNKIKFGDALSYDELAEACRKRDFRISSLRAIILGIIASTAAILLGIFWMCVAAGEKAFKGKKM